MDKRYATTTTGMMIHIVKGKGSNITLCGIPRPRLAFHPQKPKFGNICNACNKIDTKEAAEE